MINGTNGTQVIALFVVYFQNGGTAWLVKYQCHHYITRSHCGVFSGRRHGHTPWLFTYQCTSFHCLWRIRVTSVAPSHCLVFGVFPE